MSEHSMPRGGAGRSPICIAGMHRSGTSMVARLLHLCGVYVGREEDVAVAGPDNPAGFWENPLFVALNDEVLNQFGGGWDHPRPWPDDWAQAPGLAVVRQRAALLVEDLAARSPWGWKDPRTALTLRFWQGLLPALRVVVCVRNPLEVALSLQRRSSMSYQLGLALWEAYAEALLATTRPGDRVVTAYASYLTDPGSELRRLVSALELEVSEEAIDAAAATVDPGLRHHQFEPAELSRARVPEHVVDLYLQLLAEAHVGPEEMSPRPAEPADTGVTTSVPPASLPPALDLEYLRAHRLQHELEVLRPQLRRLEDALGERERTLAERDALLQQREEAIGALRAEHDAQVQRLARERDAIEELRRRLADEQAERDVEVQRLVRELAEVEEARRRLAEELSQQHRETERLLGEVSVLAADRARSAEERAIALAALAEAQRRGAALADELAQKRQESQGAQDQLAVLDGRSRAGVAQNERLQEQLGGLALQLDLTRNQMSAIYRSRLWRVGHAYWQTLRRMGLLRASTPFWLPPPAGFHCPSCQQRLLLTESGRLISLGASPVETLTAREAGAASPPVSSPASEEPVAPGPVESATAVEWLAGDRYDVICLSIIDWHFRRQRPQQLMLQFAAAGHRVFYVSNRPITEGPPYQLRRIERGVWEVTLRGEPHDPYGGRLSPAALETLFTAVDALRRDQAIGAAAVVVQLPFWRPLGEALRTRLGWPLVYDCMDHHAGFSDSTSQTLDEERELLRGADLVIASSQALAQEARRHSARVEVVRNGCDWEHFASVGVAANNGRKVIGYYGAIADWFDGRLMEELATTHPEWEFVLVGSTYLAALGRLAELPNVTLTGERPYAELPRWLGDFDVGIIPFRRVPLTEATNPVKVYEMLAGGKPVVSVPIPEVAALAPMVRLASTAADFADQIEAAIADDCAEQREVRRRFAADHTWTRRFASMAPAVAETFPRVSIVIVTYGNRELTRLCLDSLFHTLEWPKHQVVVVDNGSTDGTPDLLRELADRHPGLEPILNRDNVGFAAATNQGLRQATGDYLVLLNNDTVLCHGWLAALVRHLRQDPRIGLIGPSTNAIGNEAMVEVGYSGIDEMPAWAEAYTRAHDGELVEMRMLAMFCVAMRRELFERLGPLDERFGVGMFEDDDYSQRTRELGLRVVCARDAFVHHWMKAAFSLLPAAEYEAIFQRNRELYESKWATSWVPHGRS